MKPEVVSNKNKRRRLALNLGLFLFSIYLFVYRGGFHSIDEVSMFAVTESLVKFGHFNTDQIAWTQWTTIQAEAQGFFGSDGHVYSKKGLALSLAQVPLYWLALILPGLGMLQTVSLLNVFITAATGLLVFMFIHRLNFSSLTAAIVCLIFGMATIAVVYAKYLFSEPLAGFLLLLAAYMLLAYRQEGGLRHVVMAGLAAGFAVLTRANNLFLLPVFGLYLLWVEKARQKETRRQGDKGINKGFPIPPASLSSYTPVPYLKLLFAPSSLAFVFTLTIPGLIMFAYNTIRSGNPLQTGYDLTLFSSNAVLGLYKLLFSPLRGLFVYSPILLLSVPGWWRLRRTSPAESWLFAGLAGITLALFSFWSSGEGLSWGSRFLVPLVPFFAICLAPIIEQDSIAPLTGAGEQGSAGSETHASRITHHILRFTFYALLPLSFFIQLLAVAINPWVFLARMQAEFGGEFFLEKTAALYDFRYSQIAGQLQSWALTNSDVAWWQPWGFNGVAFGLSLGLILVSGWLLWRNLAGELEIGNDSTPSQPPLARGRGGDDISSTLPPLQGGLKGVESPLTSNSKLFNSRLCEKAPMLLYATIPITIAVTCFLLTRYNQTDRQFGPPDDSYTQALNTVASQASTGDQIITVQDSYYHVSMNRFKTQIPLIGFAQQVWPPPETALPLLKASTSSQNSWLVTIGFPPAASDNAAEQWLALNTFKISDEWLPDEVRLVRFSANQPAATRRLETSFGNEIKLVAVNLLDTTHPGQPLPVEFTWQPLTQPQTNYNLFLQLLNNDNVLIAQHDSPPNGGYTPTSGWQTDQLVSSRHALIIPAHLSPGDYRLIAGLYNPANGQRLLINSGHDFVELGNITITGEVE